MRGEYSQRLKLARHIRENESSSWPTAKSSDGEGGRITPTDYIDGSFRSKRKKSDQWFGAKLRDAVETYEERNWPTPRSGNPSSRKKGTGGKVLNEEAKKNWATPQVTDIRKDVRKPEERTAKANKGGCSNLREQVHNIPPAPEKSNTSGKSQGSLKLSPNWVEQLMGLKVGWTQLPTEWTD